MNVHTAVLLKQAVDALQVKKGGRYIDCTYGSGGHSKQILKQGGLVLAIDWDEKTTPCFDKKCIFVRGNYSQIDSIASTHSFIPVEGVLYDLGISMEQIRNSKRGFSYKAENESLDMRISKSLDVTAKDIVNSYNSQQLYDILANGSEELNSRAISEALVRARRIKTICTVGEINSVIARSVKRERAPEKILRRVYQAIRIEVNNELNYLEESLKKAFKLISSDGKVVVITFHSGETRVVKRCVRDCGLEIKVIKPPGNQIKIYERSATIRVISKKYI